MSICYFRCQASTDHTTYQNKNNLNKVETFSSVGYTNLIHLIQMRSYNSLNEIPTILVTITITNKWNRTVDAFCASNAILGQMINGWLKINQFRNNLKRFSLSGLQRIDIIIYLIKSTSYKSFNDNRFYWELVPGPRLAKLRIECLFDRSNARGRFWWFLTSFER